MSLSKNQKALLDAMHAGDGRSWLADHAHGGKHAASLASAWWRGMRALERRGLVKRLKNYNARGAEVGLALGFELTDWKKDK